MNYVFGDSTPSELTSNFLEFFRDALDFSVHALLADERIHEGESRIQVLRDESDVEIERLTRFISLALEGVDAAERAAGGEPDSPTAACAPNVRESIAHAQRNSLSAIHAKLAAEIAQVEADEAATRRACLEALATLLRPHDPPDAKATVNITLNGAGAYEASREAKAGFGLDWKFDLAIPDGSVWSAPLRVERIVTLLEIRAPQLSGWISKEVKVKPQKLERFLVSEIIDDGVTFVMKLRTELGADVGFDFKVKGEVVKGTRVGPEDDASIGPFEMQPDDATKIFELAEKLRENTADLEQKQLIAATTDNVEFSTLPDFVAFIEDFVAMMKPIVVEIAERSLAPNELIIRRLLTNDRREEIFVSKKTLREKYAALAPRLQAVFAPLGLDTPTQSTRPPLPRASEKTPEKAEAPVRAELPKSHPPPSLADKGDPPTPAPTAASPKIIARPPNSRISSSDLKTIPIATLQASAPPLPPPAPPPPPSVPAVRAAATSTPEITMSDDSDRNKTLVASLKKIALLSRNGRTEEAYREYATLFSGSAFTDYRPEDQRQALKLMVLAKSPPALTDTVREAHRAALGRIESLVKAQQEPADYELLGVTKLLLDDVTASAEAFSKALEIERAKNPQSELCGNLMKRVAAL